MIDNQVILKKLFSKNTVYKYVQNIYNNTTISKNDILKDLIFSNVDLENQNNFLINPNNNTDNNLLNHTIKIIRSKLFINKNLNFYLTKDIIQNDDTNYSNLLIDTSTIVDEDLQSSQLLTIKSKKAINIFFDVQGLIFINIDNRYFTDFIDVISNILTNTDLDPQSVIHAIHIFMNPRTSNTAIIHLNTSDIILLKEIINLIKSKIPSGYLNSYPIGSYPIEKGFSYREVYTTSNTDDDVSDVNNDVDDGNNVDNDDTTTSSTKLHENIKYYFEDLYDLVNEVHNKLNSNKLTSITHEGVLEFINETLDSKRLTAGYSSTYYGLISNLFSTLRNNSTIFDVLWDGLEEYTGNKDIQNFLEDPKGFLSKNILNGYELYWKNLPKNNHIKFIKLDENNYQILYSNDNKDKNSIPSIFLVKGNQTEWDPFVQYKDIPITPSDKDPHIITLGFITSETIVLTQKDDKTYRLYKDGRINSSVIYDNQLITLDQDDYNPSSDILVGAIAFLIFIDNTWKLFVQKNKATLTNKTGTNTFGQSKFNESYQGPKVTVLTPSAQFNSTITLHDALITRINYNISKLREKIIDIESLIDIKIDAKEGNNIDNLIVPKKGSRQYEYLLFLQQQEQNNLLNYSHISQLNNEKSLPNSNKNFTSPQANELSEYTKTNKIMVGSANFIGDWQTLLQEIITKSNEKITLLLGNNKLNDIKFTDRVIVSKLYLLSININKLYYYHNSLTLIKLKEKYGLDSVVKDFSITAS